MLVARPVTDALSDGELEQAADAVEVGVNSGNLGKRLRIDGAFQASTHETASEDLCARVARLPSERIEPREIVFVHSERDDSRLRLPLRAFH
jgi:hypothetical protein